MLFDALIFIAAILVSVIAYLFWKLGSPLKWVPYFKTDDGKGILKGILLAPTVIIVIALILSLLPSSAKGSWLNDASVFAGIDYTRKLSPMCDANQVDDQGTSNLGFRMNFWESESENIRVNSKYTHHSCVLGSDNKTYDALGVEVEWKVWER